MCTTCLRVLLMVNSWMKEWKEWKSSFVIEISVSEWRQRRHVWLKEWMVDPSSTSWKQSSIEFVSKRSNIIADVLYWTGYFFFAIFGLIGYHFLHLKLNKKQETFWSEFIRKYLQARTNMLPLTSCDGTLSWFSFPSSVFFSVVK